MRVDNAVKPAAIFQNNMILQAGKPVMVWGTGAPGQFVTISIQET